MGIEMMFRASVELSREGRTLVGLAVPWEKPALVVDPGSRPYLEEFKRSSTDRTLAQHPDDFPVFVNHRRNEDPIGVVAFQRSDEGLIYEAPISKTSRGDEYLTLVEDGAMRSVSIGFRPISQMKRMSPEGAVTSRTEVALRELSIAPSGFGQYPDARVDSVRATAMMATKMDPTFADIAETVEDAITQKLFGADGPPANAYVYLRDITAEWAIYEVEGGKLDTPQSGPEKVDYTINDDGTCTLSDPTAVQVAYVPRSFTQPSRLERRLALIDPLVIARVRG